MSTPILATKLYIPPHHPQVVLRPRLIERLNEGLHLDRGFRRKLTLISAPAGFGKTTLVSEWVAARQQPTAWLSLDELDNDPRRFLAYLIAALQTLALSEIAGTIPKIGEGAMGMLQSHHPPPTELILTTLLNDVTTIPVNFILVLDDYHVIESQIVDNDITFLLEHLPPQMHLVITTRQDPDLPLARLRVRGQLTELRARDLRFTPTEAAQFLNQIMGLDLSSEEIGALETRTEGWIAGLQMAALSIRGRSDTASFIQAFSGSHHFVLDYLVEEVLQRQSEDVHTFLMQTSILDRLCGPLCDAVRGGTTETTISSKASSLTGQPDGRSMLEALERGNLFVIPLDDQRHWYRYHHLFAEVLQARLADEQPHQLPTLHRRASEWYQHNALPADAIHHALAAGDFERAATLIELQVRVMWNSIQEAIWFGWVKELPDDLVRARPVLSVYYALALLPGDLNAAEARLQDAEWWLDAARDKHDRPGAPSTAMIVVNEEEYRSLPATISVARAYLAGALGDLSSIVKYAQRALDLLPEHDNLWRGGAAALLGIAYRASGDLEAAHRLITRGMASLQLASGLSTSMSAKYLLADLRLAQGRLRDAASTVQQALRLVAEHGESEPQGTADLYVVLGEVSLEQGDLAAARKHLLSSKELGEHAALLESRHRWYVAMAGIKEAQGDLDGALDLLDEAERLYIRGPAPEERPIAALKTRLWVAQGRLAEALAWVRDQGLSVDDDLNYLREFEHITLARVLIAEYKSDEAERTIREAIGLLERLLQAAEAGERLRSVIEILVLLSLAHASQGDTSSALESLQRALTLAEPQGYVRIFVNEGSTMAALLRQTVKHGVTPNYVRQIWAAFGEAKAGRPVSQPLIEPLSEREIEVLRLLATELNGPEIAHELMVSLNTMRTHTKNIYTKLGVNNRRAALRRAEQLDLL